MEYDSSELGFALDAALQDMGVTQRFSIRDVMRVMANNMIKFSFPKNAAEGKGAIDKDLNKIFNSLDDPQVLEYFNSRFGDGTASKSGRLKGKKRKSQVRKELPDVKFNWDGNETRMKTWHESHRRNGKVKARSRIVAKIGKWEFASGMYVTKTALNKYSRLVYKSIAKFKAGWIPAADWLAAKTGGRLGVPAFARKQPDKRGSVEEWKNDSGYEGVTIINRIPYATRLGDYIIKRAEMKTEAYSQKATKKQAEDIARRFNERKAKAA